MSKSLGPSESVTLTPQRHLTELRIRKAIGSADVQIVGVFSEAKVDESGQPGTVLDEKTINANGRDLILAGAISEERFKAIYTEISETLHGYASAQFDE